MDEITIEELIDENAEEILAMVQRTLDESSEKMNSYVADTLDELIMTGCEIYEWESDGCPYDDSGRLRQPGKTCTRETSLFDFLSGCTGSNVPTFISGSGMYFPTWEDRFTDDETEWSINSAYWNLAKSAVYKWLEDSGVPADSETVQDLEETIYELLFELVNEESRQKYCFLFEDRERAIGDFLSKYATGAAEIAVENNRLYNAELKAFVLKLEMEADSIPLEKKFTINATDKKFMADLYEKYTQREVSLLVWRDRLGTPRGKKFFDFERIVREEIEAEKVRLAQKHFPISVNPKDYFGL